MLSTVNTRAGYSVQIEHGDDERSQLVLSSIKSHLLWINGSGDLVVENWSPSSIADTRLGAFETKRPASSKRRHRVLSRKKLEEAGYVVL